MHVNGCWFGFELDFTLELPTISFSFGPFVDEEPEPEVQPVLERRGDALSTAIGFVRSIRPEWDDPGMSRQYDPEPDGEDV